MCVCYSCFQKLRRWRLSLRPVIPSCFLPLDTKIFCSLLVPDVSEISTLGVTQQLITQAAKFFDLCSRNKHFKSPSDHRLSWLRFFMVFSVSPCMWLDSIFKIVPLTFPYIFSMVFWVTPGVWLNSIFKIVPWTFPDIFFVVFSVSPRTRLDTIFKIVPWTFPYIFFVVFSVSARTRLDSIFKIVPCTFSYIFFVVFSVSPRIWLDIIFKIVPWTFPYIFIVVFSVSPSTRLDSIFRIVPWTFSCIFSWFSQSLHAYGRILFSELCHERFLAFFSWFS